MSDKTVPSLFSGLVLRSRKAAVQPPKAAFTPRKPVERKYEFEEEAPPDISPREWALTTYGLKGTVFRLLTGGASSSDAAHFVGYSMITDDARKKWAALVAGVKLDWKKEWVETHALSHFIPVEKWVAKIEGEDFSFADEIFEKLVGWLWTGCRDTVSCRKSLSPVELEKVAKMPHPRDVAEILQTGIICDPRVLHGSFHQSGTEDDRLRAARTACFKLHEEFRAAYAAAFPTARKMGDGTGDVAEAIIRQLGMGGAD